VNGFGLQLQFGTTAPAYAFGMSATGNGPAATGTLAFTPPAGVAGDPHLARVTCLTVVGNHAIATGRFVWPTAEKGQRVVMEALDNNLLGPPPPDDLRFSFTGFIHPDPSDPTGACWLPVLPPVPILQGDIAVGHLGP
jgi:hypothetical protein